MREKNLIYILGILLFMACGAQNADIVQPPAASADALSELPPQQVLFDNLVQIKKILVVCSDSDAALCSALENYLGTVRKHREDFTVLVKKYTAVSDSELTHLPLYIIGTLESNPLLNRLGKDLPLALSKTDFSFDGKKYSATGDIIKIGFYPNPLNTQLPLTIITGNSDKYVSDYILSAITKQRNNFFWDNWGYQIYHDDNRIVLGNFSEDSSTRWQLDKKIHWEFDYSGKIAGENSVFTFIDHNSGLSKKYIDSVIKNSDIYASELVRQINRPLTQKIMFHIYPSTEIKGLMTNNNEQVSIDEKNNSVHAVLNNEFEGVNSGLENVAVLRAAFGIPAVEALEYGSAKQSEKSDNYYAIQLYRSGNLPSLEEMLTNEYFEKSSPIIMQYAAGLFVHWLMQKDTDVFFSRYTKYTKNELLGFKAEYYAYLDKIKTTIPPPAAINNNISTPVKGFNFAHEGYQIYNGYGGTTAELAIEKMKSIATNSIAIIPYTGAGDLDKPTEYQFPHGAGSENDAAVIHAMYEAKKNGFTVLLKPQIFCWQGWTGDMKMQNEKDWNTFFDYYTKWIMHYALLAQIYKADIFCIGVEMQDATTSHPEAWRKIIADVRKIYGGQITYAANWGYEFDTIDFWDALDYMSVNCYYPLSDKNDPTDEELKNNFEQILDHLEKNQQKYKKPFLFTEIGFKSIDRPWLKPHFDDDEQNVNQLSQKRCYKAVFEALEDEPWVSGIYFWQFPTYMEYGRENTKGFTPCGKEAEAVVQQYFSKN